MKRYLLNLFITIFLVGQNAYTQDEKTQDAETRDVKTQNVKTHNVLGRYIPNFGIGIKKLVNRLRIGALSELIFSDTIKSFSYIIDLLQFYMDETQEMVYREFIKQRDWMEELRKDEFIGTAFFEAGNTRYSVGEASSIGVEGDFSFYISEKGEVHYIYYKIDDLVSLDLSLTFSGFGNYVSNLKRSPGSLFLYDSNNNQYSMLFGNIRDIPEEIVKKGENASKLRTSLTVKGLMIIKAVDVEDSGLVLIAVYPYKIGGSIVQLFGLIGVVILTILLLSFAIYFTFQSYEKKGVTTMDEEENADVINEIDKELSGIGKEGVKPAPETHTEEKEKDEALKRLEDDGIFINN